MFNSAKRADKIHQVEVIIDVSKIDDNDKTMHTVIIYCVLCRIDAVSVQLLIRQRGVQPATTTMNLTIYSVHFLDEQVHVDMVGIL